MTFFFMKRILIYQVDNAKLSLINKNKNFKLYVKIIQLQLASRLMKLDIILKKILYFLLEANIALWWLKLKLLNMFLKKFKIKLRENKFFKIRN